MSSLEAASILELYQYVITVSCMKLLQQETDSKVRRDIYCTRVVVAHELNSGLVVRIHRCGWARASIVDLYGRRAEIETDLRCLKRTVNLHHIQAKSVDMLEKELLIAMSAYNLLRAVMVVAARRHGIAPRQLSFSVLNVVFYGLPKLLTAPTEQQRDHLQNILERVNQCRLAVRRKLRSHPRSVWRHRQAFPVRPAEKSK
jgi:hypothetical protein